MTNRQRMIITIWESFEEDDPDISTERLLAQVAVAAKTGVDEVCEALEAEVNEKEANE
jgi:hypothetical protein